MKASRLTVVERRDGSYQIAGDTAIYTVRFSPHTSRYYCECHAASARVLCSHLLALQFHLNSRQLKAE